MRTPAAALLGSIGAGRWSWSGLSHAPELHLAPADFTAASWANSGSAGGSLDQANGALQPSASTINGVACGLFTGKWMASALTIGQVMTASAYHAFMVVDISAITEDRTSFHLCDELLSDADGHWGIGLRQTAPKVVGGHNDGSNPVQAYGGVFATGTPTLIEWKYTGGTISVRVGSDAAATQAATAVDAVTSVLRLGANAVWGQTITGKIAEPVCSKVIYSGADLTNIRNYYATTYGVTV